jgi:hypothetical protein
MDRAVDVDRGDAAEVSLATDDAPGWDAHAVWRERVHAARIAAARDAQYRTSAAPQVKPPPKVSSSSS